MTLLTLLAGKGDGEGEGDGDDACEERDTGGGEGWESKQGEEIGQSEVRLGRARRLSREIFHPECRTALHLISHCMPPPPPHPTKPHTLDCAASNSTL